MTYILLVRERLWPSDTIWRHIRWSTTTQVIPWCGQTANHNLSQNWIYLMVILQEMLMIPVTETCSKIAYSNQSKETHLRRALQLYGLLLPNTRLILGKIKYIAILPGIYIYIYTYTCTCTYTHTHTHTHTYINSSFDRYWTYSITPPYPRPVLAFGYCRCLHGSVFVLALLYCCCLCVSVCVSVRLCVRVATLCLSVRYPVTHSSQDHQIWTRGAKH